MALLIVLFLAAFLKLVWTSLALFSDFPLEIQGSVAGYSEQSGILVCGGNGNGYDEIPTEQCYRINPQTTENWITINPMQEKYLYNLIMFALQQIFVKMDLIFMIL
jgi:hypothetical protein